MTLTCDHESRKLGHMFCNRLNERNVWVKLNENRPKCPGDMEWT